MASRNRFSKKVLDDFSHSWATENKKIRGDECQGIGGVRKKERAVFHQEGIIIVVANSPENQDSCNKQLDE